MSLTLSLDTAGTGGAVALARPGELLSVVRHDPAAGYAESLFSLFDQVFAEAATSWGEVERIAVVRGPGSFTGLRIGVMTAKSLAFARGLELWAARGPEVAAAAVHVQHPERTVVVLQSAGRGALTHSVHRPGERAADPERITDAGLRARIAHHGRGGAICLVGDTQGHDLGDLDIDDRRPEVASDLARLASTGTPPAELVDPVALVPYYVGPSQAERTRGLDLTDEVHRPVPPRPGGED